MVAETQAVFQLPTEVATRLRSPDGYVLEQVQRFQRERPEFPLQFLDPLLRELDFLRGSMRWSITALQEMHSRHEQLKGFTEQMQAQLPAPPSENSASEMQEDGGEEEEDFDATADFRDQLYEEFHGLRQASSKAFQVFHDKILGLTENHAAVKEELRVFNLSVINAIHNLQERLGSAERANPGPANFDDLQSELVAAGQRVEELEDRLGECNAQLTIEKQMAADTRMLTNKSLHQLEAQVKAMEGQLSGAFGQIGVVESFLFFFVQGSVAGRFLFGCPKTFALEVLS